MELTYLNVGVGTYDTGELAVGLQIRACDPDNDGLEQEFIFTTPATNIQKFIDAFTNAQIDLETEFNN